MRDVQIINDDMLAKFQSGSIAYTSGYKYQLEQDFCYQTSLRPETEIDTRFIRLTTTGLLFIRAAYAWDGASGPAFDTPTIMRGSLVHDALYQLMREGLLDREVKTYADGLLVDICKEDGMNWFRRQRVAWAVAVGGGPSTDPANKKKVRYAP